MAIKVHGSLFSTATMRVLACLNEKGLDYEFVPIDMKAGEHKKEPFISINPFGQVPGFEDGDLKLFGNNCCFFQILQIHLGGIVCFALCLLNSRKFSFACLTGADLNTDKGTPLVYHDPKEMAVLFVAMQVESLQYNPPAGKLTLELAIKPMLGMATDEAVVEEKEAELAKVLDVYESRLAQSKYVSGDSFTLADLHHLPTLNYLMGTRVRAVFDSRPRVSAWCADILARPAWQKVIAMQHN